MSEPAPEHGGSGRDEGLTSDAIDTETGARGAVYALVARAFTEPDPELYGKLADGSLDSAVATLIERTGLDVDPPDLTVEDDRETLAARYNDLFVIGYSEVIDGTDGTIDSQGPPASMYESTYRSDVSWNDVNLDLARAYEHFGCEISGDERRHHDHVRLELEFAGYLCRLAAADGRGSDADGSDADGSGADGSGADGSDADGSGADGSGADGSGADGPGSDENPNVDRARLDFHDRHLSVLASGLHGSLDDLPGTGVYGRLARFLDAFVAADVEDLAVRLDAGVGSKREHAGGDGSNTGESP